jgi:hypothetical protein
MEEKTKATHRTETCEGALLDAWKERNRLAQDHRWIASNWERLYADHKNKYIAVLDKKVCYEDANVFNMIDRIKADGKRADQFAVEHMRRTCLLF